MPSQCCDSQYCCWPVTQLCDGPDERNCPTEDSPTREPRVSDKNTYTWLVTFPVLMVICTFLVVICCAKRRTWWQQRDVYASHATVPPSSFNRPLGSPNQPDANRAVMFYPDYPPSYEASQQHINMGYLPSESAENVSSSPPPYMQHRSAQGNFAAPFTTSTVSLPTPAAHHSLTPPRRPLVAVSSSSSLAGTGALYALSSTELSRSPVDRSPESYSDVSSQNERNRSLEVINRQQTQSKRQDKVKHNPGLREDTPSAENLLSTAHASGGIQNGGQDGDYDETTKGIKDKSESSV